MFLSHFSSTSISEVLEMSITDIAYWHQEAVNLHNYLTPTNE